MKKEILTLKQLNLNRSEDPEKPENAEASPETPEAPAAMEGRTSKGEARYEAISASISKAGEKVSGWWKRGKELFKTGVAGGKELLKKGVGAGGELLKKGAIEVLSTPQTLAAGGKFVGEKVEQGVGYVGEKAEQAGKWVESSATSVYEFGSNQYNRAEQFVGNKAQQMEDYITNKALLLEAIASLIAEKTAEKVEQAKQKTEDNYRMVLEYARNAIDSAALKSQKAKEGFNKIRNAVMARILQLELKVRMQDMQAQERHLEAKKREVEQTLAKLAQFQQLETQLA